MKGMRGRENDQNIKEHPKEEVRKVLSIDFVSN